MLLRGDRGTRYPAVAGMFYESDPDALREQIEWCFKHPVGPGKLPKVPGDLMKGFAGYIAPHAGYIYSGPVAAHTYLRLASRGRPETVIIAGPNPTGLGTMVSVMAEGVWTTPLGHVEVDSELAEAIVRHSKYADMDERAHIHEHSVEVQLPFLQYLYGDSVRIVPIVMYAQMMQTAADLAGAVAHALEETGRRVVFIASSDFSHYVPYEDAYRRDRHALEAIEALNAEKLFRV
ncbi:MAG: AmmeMemoRadiSam system protein B, partial [Candidatus Korarchaeota archaeon]|nr:AmmeMemoRadiSam system protein B [Candidatus Korarchaeota archaeon]